MLKILPVSLRVEVNVLTMADKLYAVWISITSFPPTHSTLVTWASALFLEYAKCATASGPLQRKLPLPVSLVACSLTSFRSLLKYNLLNGFSFDHSTLNGNTRPLKRSFPPFLIYFPQ